MLLVINGRFMTTFSHIFDIYIHIFHKPEVQTVILRCLTGLNWNWFKSYDTNNKYFKAYTIPPTPHTSFRQFSWYVSRKPTHSCQRDTIAFSYLCEDKFMYFLRPETMIMLENKILRKIIIFPREERKL